MQICSTAVYRKGGRFKTDTINSYQQRCDMNTYFRRV